MNFFDENREFIEENISSVIEFINFLKKQTHLSFKKNDNHELMHMIKNLSNQVEDLKNKDDEVMTNQCRELISINGLKSFLHSNWPSGVITDHTDSKKSNSADLFFEYENFDLFRNRPFRLMIEVKNYKGERVIGRQQVEKFWNDWHKHEENMDAAAFISWNNTNIVGYGDFQFTWKNNKPILFIANAAKNISLLRQSIIFMIQSCSYRRCVSESNQIVKCSEFLREQYYINVRQLDKEQEEVNYLKRMLTEKQKNINNISLNLHNVKQVLINNNMPLYKNEDLIKEAKPIKVSDIYNLIIKYRLEYGKYPETMSEIKALHPLATSLISRKRLKLNNILENTKKLFDEFNDEKLENEYEKVK